MSRQPFELGCGRHYSLILSGCYLCGRIRRAAASRVWSVELFAGREASDAASRFTSWRRTGPMIALACWRFMGHPFGALGSQIAAAQWIRLNLYQAAP